MMFLSCNYGYFFQHATLGATLQIAIILQVFFFHRYHYYQVIAI